MRYWIIPHSVDVMNLVQLFAESDFVDWKTQVNANIEVGDIVFIYSTLPVGQIKYKTRVIRKDIPFAESLDQEKFFYDKAQYRSGKINNSYFRLERLETALDNVEELHLHTLKLYGIKSMQCAQTIEGEILGHIYIQFKETFEY